MIRLKYLIPRVVILMLAFTAVWLSKDLLVRQEMVRQAQRLTGAKVEIGQLQANLQNERLFLKDLKIADPQNPMSNLLQADLVYLKIDREQLWHRRLIVTDGQVNGLVVNAPRTESGALSPEEGGLPIGQTKSQLDASRPFDFSLDANLWKKETEVLGQQLLNQVSTDAHLPVLSLSTEAVCRDTQTQWPARIGQWKEAVESFRQRFDALNATIESDSRYYNPLRDKAKHEAALHSLEKLDAEGARLREGLQSELEQLNRDKHRIQTVSTSDRQQLVRQQPGNAFDEQLVSELLLHQENRQLVAEVVAWMIWFRNAVPSTGNAEVGAAGPIFPWGEDLPINGQESSPHLLIKKIELEGSGWFAQHHFSFVGSAFNLTPTPSKAIGTARFELRALGKENVLIDCEVDRTGLIPVDRLKIQFPELGTFPAVAGHEQSMLVSWGATRRANADITLEMVGDQISGELIVRHSNVSLHVDSLNDLLGGNEVRLRINQGLNRIDQFKAALKIEGTLSDYSTRLESDLGMQFSKIVDSSVVDRISHQNEKVLEQVSQVAASTLHRFENEFEPVLRQQLEHLSQDVLRMADLSNAISPQETEGWRKLR